MMPGTGDDTGMMPGTGDDTGMMPGTGDDTGMMPGTGDGTGGGETPMKPPTPMPYVVDGLVANPSPSAFANSAADTRDSVLTQGEMLAPMTVGIERGGGVVNAPKEGTTYLKSISSDGAGGYHVNYVLAGEDTPIHLTIDDRNQNRDYDYRKVTDDGSGYWFWRYNSGFSPLFTYFDGYQWLYIPSTGGYNRRGIAIFGARTAPENLPAMGSAIYEGRMYADIWNADDTNFNTSRTQLRGLLTLKANLDDGEISGWINGHRLTSSRASGNIRRTLRGSLITISGGEIDDGRFTADWMSEDSVMSRALEDSVGGFSGKMLGEFFGPAGEEVGGVMNGNRAADAMGTTPEQHFYGVFGGVGRVPAVRDSTEAFEPYHSFALEQEFSGADVGTRSPDQGEAYVKTIAGDGAGGVSVTYVINGVESEIDFGAGDANSGGTLGKIIGDKEYFFWRYGALGLNYADVTGWAHDINDSAGTVTKRYRGHNVHGVATENLPTTGSATYEGRVYADSWDVNNPVEDLGRANIRGDVALEANFGSGDVTGRIDGLELRPPGESSYAPMGSENALELSNGAIAGSGFTADWTGMDTDANSVLEDNIHGFSGAMNGGFYGPAAEEVAGVFSGSRAAIVGSTPETLIRGSFGAKKTGQ